MADQHSTTDDEVPDYGPEYWEHFLDDLDEEGYGGEGPRLITVDMLRAAGAFDVPASWRKSLAPERKKLPLFPDWVEEDDTLPPDQQSTPPDADDESADEPA